MFFQTQEEIVRRPVTPKLVRNLSFDSGNDPRFSGTRDSFSNIRTGNVQEKRNFWIRSTSTERLNARHEMSPGKLDHFVSKAKAAETNQNVTIYFKGNQSNNS